MIVASFLLLLAGSPSATPAQTLADRIEVCREAPSPAARKANRCDRVRADTRRFLAARRTLDERLIVARALTGAGE